MWQHDPGADPQAPQGSSSDDTLASPEQARDAWLVQSHYARDLAGHDLLSAEEERALLEQTRQGPPEERERARNRLLACNYRMVVKVARHFEKSAGDLELSDLIGEGVLGLCEALNRFDLSRPVRLITYAWPWVNLYVRRAIHDSGYAVRVPSTARQRLAALRRTLDACIAEVALQPEGSPEREQALEQRRQAELAWRKGLRLLLPAADGSNRVSLPVARGPAEEDSLSGQEQSQPCLQSPEEGFANTLHKQRTQLLAQHLQSLPALHRQIVEARYGLGQYEASTFLSIAKGLGMPRKRVEELEAEARKLLLDCIRRGSPRAEFTDYFDD